MKKRLLILAFLAGCNALLAQAPNTMDTIIGREPTYYYQFWFDSTDFLHARTCTKVLGGATGTELARYIPSLPCEAQCADTSLVNWYENFILYKPTASGLVMLASQQYSVLDTVRWMKLHSNKQYYESNIDSILIRYCPIYEAYFDEPVFVTDSFYVGTTNYHGVVDSLTMTYPGLPVGIGCYYPDKEQKPCYRQHYMWREENYSIPWSHVYDDLVLIIFPIIDTVQPRCEKPLGLNIRQDSMVVYLAWDTGSNNRTWEVAYGLADEDPETYPTLTTSTPTCTLTALSAGEEYAARVRASCFDNARYSGWSDTVRFVREGEPLSISNLNDGGIRLLPNPASTEVQILSDWDLRHIAIYDMQGHAVMTQQADGKGVLVDISGLAKGSYVVRTTTTHGISTSKLTIE